MQANYEYQLRWASRVGGRILDYGCGGGEVVGEGLRRGLNLWGTDVFHADGAARAVAAEAGLLGNRVVEMIDGRIPFPDASFDAVMSNQVIEHVPDLPQVLSEMRRVLKPGGRFFAAFPSREVLREGHIGIFLAHRLPKGRGRFAYTLILRSIGFGYLHEQQPSALEWTRFRLDWIDRFTFYRPRKEIEAALAELFRFEHVEEDWLRFRLESKRSLRALSRVATWKPVVPAIRAFVHRFAGLVLVGETRAA